MALATILMMPRVLVAQELCLVNPHLAHSKLTEAHSAFAQWSPVAVAKISADLDHHCIAEQIQLSILKILHGRQIATVEIEDQVLDEILSNLEFQSSAMVNKDTTVNVGEWVAAKFLLRGNLYKRPNGNLIYYRYSLINLQTRLQEVDNCITFQVQDCLLQSELLNLPAPSPGGSIALPDPERRH